MSLAGARAKVHESMFSGSRRTLFYDVLREKAYSLLAVLGRCLRTATFLAKISSREKGRGSAVDAVGGGAAEAR